MEKELRIIVAGSRDFEDYKLLSDTLMNYLAEINNVNTIDYQNQVKFISGGARGADTLGEKFAYRYEYEVVRFPAYWRQFGKSAGVIRDTEMAIYAAKKTGVLFAFWDGKSRGTKHMIDVANKYGLDVHVIKY